MSSRSVRRAVVAAFSMWLLAGCASGPDVVASAPASRQDASGLRARAKLLPVPPLPGSRAAGAVPAVPAGPGADTDHDRIADADDECPSEPEVYNGLADEDGCPDRGRVVVTESRIEIVEGAGAAAPGPDRDFDAILDVDDAAGADLDDVDGPPEVVNGLDVAGPRRYVVQTAPVVVAQGPRPARLTAAAVADADRRDAYLEYLGRHGSEAAELGLDLSRRVRFRVVDGEHRAVHDASLTLSGPGFQAAGRTYADGTFDFYPSLVAPAAAGPATLDVRSGPVGARARVVIPRTGDARDVVVVLPAGSSLAPRALELAFLIDATGSMGDEAAYVRQEVASIVRRVRAAVQHATVRVAATFYRDRQDPLPLEQIPFSTDVEGFVALMERVEAGGGDDYPEDMNAGLAAALTTLEWSEGQAVRVLVLIADAPPQPYADFPFTHREAMVEAGARGIRILPVAASGADRVVEYLFRAMGAFTSTPYVYLTDDSGVGGHHLEADTDRIAVEMFGDLLVRMLVSDLQGHGMHEPIAP